MVRPIRAINDYFEGKTRTAEWRREVGFVGEKRRLQLELEAAVPWAGRLALVNSFKPSWSEAATKAEAIAGALNKRGILSNIGLRWPGIQKIYLGSNGYGTLDHEATMLHKAFQVHHQGTSDILRTWKPEPLDHFHAHPSLTSMPDKARNELNRNMKKRAAAMGFNLALLINGANAYGSRTGARPDDQYVAITSFANVNLPGINGTEEMVPGTTLVLSDVDTEAGKVSWEVLDLTTSTGSAQFPGSRGLPGAGRD